MTEPARSNSSAATGRNRSWYAALPRWARISIGLFALVVIGFLVRIVVINQSLVGGVHERNYHDLDVAAKGLENWPNSIRLMADKGVGGAGQQLYHPDIGRYEIEYFEDDKKCGLGQPAFRAGTRPGVVNEFMVNGWVKRSPNDTSPLPPDARCFKASVPLERFVNLRESAPDFSHLLILASDGRVLAQTGQTTLPITRLHEFAPPGQLVQNLSQTVAVSTGAKTVPPAGPAKVEIDDVGQVVSKTIAGASYEVYVKPFEVGGMPGACPATIVAKDQPPSRHCYAVGLMPSEKLRAAWLSPNPLTLVVLGLVLIGFVALLPLQRLLMIGSAESLNPFEGFGLIVGLQVATAIATLSVLLWAETVAEHQTARTYAARVANRIAAQADGEIERTLLHALKFDSRALAEKYPDRPVPSSEDDLTAIESLNFIGDDGRSVPGINTIALHSRVGRDIDVSNRDYFGRVVRNETRNWDLADVGSPIPQTPDPVCQPRGSGNDGPIRFAVGQVRAQTDGSAKTVLAVRCTADPKVPYMLNAVTLRSTLAPVLPDPLSFMVVDLNDPNLPVLFHSNRYREGSELLVERIDGGERQLALIRALLDGQQHGDPIKLSMDYDGRKTDFAVTGMRHTDWAVLVFYPHVSVDLISATTATRALIGWFSLCLLALLVAAIHFGRFPGSWRDLWPDEGEKGDYAGLARLLALAAGLTMVPVALAIAGVLPIGVAVLSAAGLWAGSGLFFVIALSLKPRSSKPLTSNTESHYSSLVLAMLLCVAVVPMLAMWGDARRLSQALADERRSAATVQAMVNRADRNAAIRRNYGLEEQGFAPLGPSMPKRPDEACGDPGANRADCAAVARAGNMKEYLGLPFGREQFKDLAAGTVSGSKAVPPRLSDEPTFSGILFGLLSDPPNLIASACRDMREEDGWLCFYPDIQAGDRYGLSKKIGIIEHPTDWRLSPIQVGAVAAIAALLVWAIVRLTRLGLAALMGFGVPLGSIKPRRFALDELATRSLLVAPQHAVRDYLRRARDPWNLDLAELLLSTRDADLDDHATKRRFEERLYALQEMARNGRVGRLVVTGLSIMLRDPRRRRAALKFLEEADRAVESGKLLSIVLITDFSPLERILDAFDSGELEDNSAHQTREQLRWARLFQKFTTYAFAPVDKINMAYERIDWLKPQHSVLFAAINRFLVRHPRLNARVERWRENSHGKVAEWVKLRLDQRYSTDPVKHAAWVLIDECRWLPGSIIDSLLPDKTGLPITARDGLVPVPNSAYQWYYTHRVYRWALRIRSPSEAASVDYLRSTLIEHYEQCWASSTFSERIVLDAIARGNFVNMKSAIALQSLVRRGLVVLDPAPRLMNRSFAEFVCQAERPGTLKLWRDQQPRSSWSSARMPILIVIPVIALLFAVGAAQSGQQIAAMFSLVLAGGPALLNLVGRMTRSE